MAVAKQSGLPLTVDFQDGYGNRLKEGIEKLLAHGVVSINLEDFDRVTDKLLPIEKAAERVELVLTVAKKHGVDDFVVNARADPLLHGGTIPECIARGKAYLAAGATTVFVFGGRGSENVMDRDNIAKLVQSFQRGWSPSYMFQDMWKQRRALNSTMIDSLDNSLSIQRPVGARHDNGNSEPDGILHSRRETGWMERWET